MSKEEQYFSVGDKVRIRDVASLKEEIDCTEYAGRVGEIILIDEDFEECPYEVSFNDDDYTAINFVASEMELLDKEVHTTIVKKSHWVKDDNYLLVKVQVFKFKKGDKVKVTIEKCKKDE